MWKGKYFRLTEHTVINPPRVYSKAVQHGVEMFCRDMTIVFGKEPKIYGASSGSILRLTYAAKEESLGWPESYQIKFYEDIDQQLVMEIKGEDDLGIIYGLLFLSENYLGVDPFWFWADLPIMKHKHVDIPMEHYNSPEPVVKYRGWFVNDEVCLIGWKEDYPPTKEVWQPVFETLLRCGGNMVIPGTDLPKSGIHHELAVEMGLWVTHHHAEPLGAEMFLRAYPNETASYKENAPLFEKLWIDAINKQKNDNIIWTLSFRGQGDTPFWSTDPSFDTPQKRGEMISEVVHRQYELIKERVDNPVCCMALYGEISELYKGGYINVPEDVIKVWADNGYGKMVSRRQGNENLRIPSLPMNNEISPQGIYYHVTFHDLQASNHLTMIPLPADLLTSELENVLESGGQDLWLINSGNIRQHLYPLDLIKEMWKKGKINTSDHRREFLNRMYASDSSKLLFLYEKYCEATLYFGGHEDEKAGEQFYHHPARRIIGHWLRGETAAAMESLKWVTGEISFEEQITWFKDRLTMGLTDLQSLREQANEIKDTLSEENQQRFHDQLLVSIILHESGCRGFLLLLEGYEHSRLGKFPEAFVYVTEAHRAYKEGLLALHQSEHGKWRDFHRADWLTNIASTVDNVDTVRKYLRMHGDSPDFFQWYKAFIMPETEKHIYLENTHRRVRSDDELSDLLKEKFLKESRIKLS